MEINRAVATSRAQRPAAALEVITPLLADPRLVTSAALRAAHAHILTDLGDTAAADQAFTQAARLAPNPRQREHIEQRPSRPLALSPPAGTARSVVDLRRRPVDLVAGFSWVGVVDGPAGPVLQSTSSTCHTRPRVAPSARCPFQTGPIEP